MRHELSRTPKASGRSLTVAGLFAGIGGIELGLKRAGHKTLLLCEKDEAAMAVLKHRFEHVDDFVSDLMDLPSLPAVDLLAGGFPCQDLSLAGTRAGLNGDRSGLVRTVMDLIQRGPQPEFLLLENVQNLLRLQRGVHMRELVGRIEEIGYRWAYRVVDSRGFGLPQRRKRVILLASRGDVPPENVLFSKSEEPDVRDDVSTIEAGRMYGFYWTEGRRGIGWAVDAVPTIKGGSGWGIPSPPAIFVADGQFAGTPSIEVGERLQGFRAGWTQVSVEDKSLREGTRWKMVGNAVSVPVAEWVGRELKRPKQRVSFDKVALRPDRPWPVAAMGSKTDGRFEVRGVSEFVRVSRHVAIASFLSPDLSDLKRLSPRALNGYLDRAKTGSKRDSFAPEFIRALEKQLELAIS